jgi:glucose-6-phosphate isomerase
MYTSVTVQKKNEQKPHAVHSICILVKDVTSAVTRAPTCIPLSRYFHIWPSVAGRPSLWTIQAKANIYVIGVEKEKKGNIA